MHDYLILGLAGVGIGALFAVALMVAWFWVWIARSKPDDAQDTEGQGFAKPLPVLFDSAMQELGR